MKLTKLSGMKLRAVFSTWFCAKAENLQLKWTATETWMCGIRCHQHSTADFSTPQSLIQSKKCINLSVHMKCL